MHSSATALTSMPLPSHARPPVRPLYGPATFSNSQAINLLLARRDAGNSEARAHHRADHRDVQRFPVVVAPRDVGGVMAGRLDARDHLAVGIVHEDAARRGAIDVALDVALDAVGHAALGAGVLVEHARLAHGAVALYVVDAD